MTSTRFLENALNFLAAPTQRPRKQSNKLKRLDWSMLLAEKPHIVIALSSIIEGFLLALINLVQKQTFDMFPKKAFFWL